MAKKRRKRLTKEEYAIANEEAVKLHKEGLSNKEIAKIVNVAQCTVILWFKDPKAIQEKKEQIGLKRKKKL